MDEWVSVDIRSNSGGRIFASSHGVGKEKAVLEEFFFFFLSFFL